MTDPTGVTDAAPDPVASHWDDRYATVGPTAVSWFQREPSVSLRLLQRLGLGPDSSVIDVGGGASVLVDRLCSAGWADLTVLDVSQVALDVARDRVGRDAPVQWVCADLLAWAPPRTYDAWHDRAVFHFLTEDSQRDAYRAVLRSALAPAGVVVLGTFAPDGPTYCSGLPVVRYDAESLAAAIGPGFELVAAEREEHVTPADAVQPFTWVALRRKA